MASVSINANLDLLDQTGQASIKLRIIADRKPIYKVIGKVEPKFWDKKQKQVKTTHPNHADLNKRIAEIKNKILDAIQANILTKDSNIDAIISGKALERLDQKLNLSLYFDKYVATLVEAKKLPYSDKVKASWAKIVAFEKYKKRSAKNLLVSDINKNWVTNFGTWSKNIIHRAPSTTKNYIKDVRAVLKIAEGENIKIDNSAFIPKFFANRTIKNKLSNEQFSIIKNIALPQDQRISETRDLFVLSVLMKGKRISDMLTLRSIDVLNDRVFLKERKTKRDTTLELLPQALEIIEKYKAKSPYGYIFPFLSMPKPNYKQASEKEIRAYTKHISSFTTIVNKNLKLISIVAELPFQLTSHIARHTFAVMCIRAGLPLNVIQNLLEHSSYRTTEIYIAELMREDDLDDATKLVFNKLYKEKLTNVA